MARHRYLGPFRRQLNAGDRFGKYNCSAYCLALAMVDVTAGGVDIDGATVRAESTEPIPDPRSPGLNIAQLDKVAAAYRIHYYDKTGESAATMRTYARRRDVTVQVDYKTLGTWRAQAGGDFGHMLTLLGVKGSGSGAMYYTYDPLATAYRWIPCAVIERAAEVFARDTQQIAGLRFAVTDPIPLIA